MAHSSPGSTARLRSPAAARYSAEITLPNTAYLAIVVAAGRVAAGDADSARAAEGVLPVLTRYDLPKIAVAPHLLPSLMGKLVPVQHDVVHYAGQPVVLVVAETYEQAQYATTLVQWRIAFSSVHGSACEAAEVERLDR